MYYVLVEGAGFRQIRRIYPARFELLVGEVRSTLAEAGFDMVAEDGDLLLFADRNDAGHEPREVARTAERLSDVLRSRTQDLLDYLIILDYSDDRAPESALPTIRKLLIFARAANAVYVTMPVKRALEPFMRVEERGPLYAVVQFFGNAASDDRSYREAMKTAVPAHMIKTALRGGASAIWLRADDTSAVTGGLAAYRDEAGDGDSHAWISVQCTPHASGHAMAQAVVAALPPARGRDDDDAWALSVLQERISEPAGPTSSAERLDGETSLVLSRRLAQRVEEGLTTTIELRDADRCRPSAFDDLIDRLSLRGNGSEVPRCRLIAIAQRPPERLTAAPVSVEWVESVVETESAIRYGAARRYWANAGLGLNSLPATHRRTLYVLSRLAGIDGETLLDEIFPALGMSLAERRRFVGEFEFAGMLRPLGAAGVHPAVEEFAYELLSAEECYEIDRVVGEILDAQVRGGTRTVTPAIWELLSRGLDGPRRAEMRHRMLQWLSVVGPVEVFDESAASGREEAHAAEVSEAAARIRLILRSAGGPSEVRDQFQLLSAADPSTLPSAMRADVQLSLGEFLLADRRYDEALRAAKHATLMYQNQSGGGIGACHLLMARVLLQTHRPADAGHYLTFAVEESRSDVATNLIARSLESVRLFLIGNLTRAQRSLEGLVEPMLRSGLTDRLLLTWFALGRVAFELGEYRPAAAQFHRTAAWARDCGREDAARTIRAWRRRAQRLSGVSTADAADSSEAGEHSAPTAEELLFHAEHAIAEVDYAAALGYLEEAEEMERTVDRRPRLGVCWDNGFAPLEDVLIADRPGRSELLRLIRAFRGWLLAQSGKTEAGIETLYNLTRGEEGILLDPYAGLYNYLYSTVLPRERSSERDDRRTILGRSVKIVQERMSRIDDYRDKTNFLRANSWNRQLMEAARQDNLA